VTDFDCETCFDTDVIDHAGAEIPCPDCSITVKLTGLRVGPEYAEYTTLVNSTKTTMTFRAPRRTILNDVYRVTTKTIAEARRRGLKGRNWMSSGAIAIEKRITKELT